MKRTVLWVVILMPLVIVGLNQKILDSSRFSGIWYTAEGEEYLFHQGIISRNNISNFSDPDYQISGAYTFSRNSIALFLTEFEPLNSVQTLYWLPSEEGDTLCEDPFGRGSTYFFRKAK